MGFLKSKFEVFATDFTGKIGNEYEDGV